MSNLRNHNIYLIQHWFIAADQNGIVWTYIHVYTMYNVHVVMTKRRCLHVRSRCNMLMLRIQNISQWHIIKPNTFYLNSIYGYHWDIHGSISLGHERSRRKVCSSLQWRIRYYRQARNCNAHRVIFGSKLQPEKGIVWEFFDINRKWCDSF